MLTPKSSPPCKTRRTPSGYSTGDSEHRPSRPSSKPTSTMSTPACAIRCGRDSGRRWRRCWPKPRLWLAGRPSTRGSFPCAWEHYERATGAAREADDKSLLAYAAGEQAYVLADLGENEDALAVIRAAHDETRTAIPHQIKAWLYAAEGELAAAADQESACRRALDLAAREIEYGPSDEDLPYLALNLVHLARWRGNCLVNFGDPETADELTKALDAMDDSFTRAEAGVRCDLAAALHAQGERAEAQRHLRRARELAQLTGSARQRRRVRQLSRRLAGRAA